MGYRLETCQLRLLFCQFLEHAARRPAERPVVIDGENGRLPCASESDRLAIFGVCAIGIYSPDESRSLAARLERDSNAPSTLIGTSGDRFATGSENEGRPANQGD